MTINIQIRVEHNPFVRLEKKKLTRKKSIVKAILLERKMDELRRNLEKIADEARVPPHEDESGRARGKYDSRGQELISRLSEE